jgi:hypothetical protein
VVVVALGTLACYLLYSDFFARPVAGVAVG